MMQNIMYKFCMTHFHLFREFGCYQKKLAENGKNPKKKMSTKIYTIITSFRPKKKNHQAKKKLQKNRFVPIGVILKK
jgi:hypothetical protein